MTAAASTDGAVTRSEFESITERMTALEASRPAPRGIQLGSEVVTQSEFRRFKWLATFALATVLGGFGLLYQQTTDLRVEMRVLHGELLRELHTQIGGLREEMHKEHTEIRKEIGPVRERVIGLEANQRSES